MFFITAFILGLFAGYAWGETNNRNVIFILADTRTKAFQLWKEEFLNARDYYYKEEPSVYYKTALENLVYVYDLDAYSREVRDYVRLVQKTLGLAQNEPFIGVLNVPWVRRGDAWGMGDIKDATIVFQLPFDRDAYKIAAGQVYSADRKIVQEMTREDYRWILRQLIWIEK